MTHHTATPPRRPDPHVRRRRILLPLSLIFGSVLLTSCSPSDPSPALTADVTYTPASLDEASAVDDVVHASTRLGAAALNFHSQGNKNALVSPASISVVFAMLAEGAEGAAAEELGHFLGAEGAELNHAMSALLAEVAAFDGDPGVVAEEGLPDRPLLHMAQQVMISDQYEVNPDFLESLTRWYDAGVHQTDFTSDEADAALDAWVKHHTGGLIEKSGITPSENTLAILQNAVTLAAAWEHPFNPNASAPREFTLMDGQTVLAETMQQKLTTSYTEYQDWQIVRLPYTDGFAMDVALPPEGTNPDTLREDDWAHISRALAASEARQPEIDVMLPTWDLESPHSAKDLLPLLHQLGMTQTVQGNSLSGITDSEVRLDSVGHQAVMKVDEQGTIAAAVTEIEVGITSAPVKPTPIVQMHVDRPFAARIVHNETQWPMFMAVIYQPQNVS